MRNLLVLIAILFICLTTSCYQRTCPTYTREFKEAPRERQVEQVEEEVSEQNDRNV